MLHLGRLQAFLTNIRKRLASDKHSSFKFNNIGLVCFWQVDFVLLWFYHSTNFAITALYYKSFTIVIYYCNNSDLYYKTTIETS